MLALIPVLFCWHKVGRCQHDAETTGDVSLNLYSEVHVVVFRMAYSAVVLLWGIVNSNVSFASLCVLKFFELCRMGQPSLYKMSIQFLTNKPDHIPWFSILLSDRESICQSICKCFWAVQNLQRRCSNPNQTDISSIIEVLFSSAIRRANRNWGNQGEAGNTGHMLPRSLYPSLALQGPSYWKSPTYNSAQCHFSLRGAHSIVNLLWPWFYRWHIPRTCECPAGGRTADCRAAAKRFQKDWVWLTPDGFRMASGAKERACAGERTYVCDWGSNNGHERGRHVRLVFVILCPCAWSPVLRAHTIACLQNSQASDSKLFMDLIMPPATCCLLQLMNSDGYRGLWSSGRPVTVRALAVPVQCAEQWLTDLSTVASSYCSLSLPRCWRADLADLG